MVILSMVNATAIKVTSGSTELADPVELIKVSTVFHASATLDSLLMLVETVSNLTSNPSATKVKDTMLLLKLVFVYLALSMSEENAFRFLLALQILITTVSPVFATLDSNFKTVNALLSMLLFLAAQLTLSSMEFHALATLDSTKLQLADVLLALLVLLGTETPAELNLLELALLDTSSILTQVNASQQLLHAEIMLTSTELAVFVSVDSTQSTEFVNNALSEQDLMVLNVQQKQLTPLTVVQTRLLWTENAFATQDST